MKQPWPSFGKFCPPWLLYAFTAATCWAIWGVLAKGPSRELSGWTTQVLFTFALLPSAALALWLNKPGATGSRVRGLAWGFVSGLAAGIGDLCFYLALQAGAETSIAIPLISLYPLVTLAIAYFCLKERINLVQGIGILLAIAAIMLLSSEETGLFHSKVSAHGIASASWLIYTLVALVCAGLFTTTQKLSTNHVPAELSYLAWCSAFGVIALAVCLSRPISWDMRSPVVWSALAAGALNGFGVIAAFAAYRSGGKAAVVAPLAATVQPLITVLLSVAFLSETIGSLEGLGIALAVCAAAALAREESANAEPRLC